MSADRTEALHSDAQVRETLVMQINVLSKAIEQITRLLWAHPKGCNGDFDWLESLGLAASCLVQASKVLASDKPSMGAQLAMLRSLRERLETLPRVAE